MINFILQDDKGMINFILQDDKGMIKFNIPTDGLLITRYKVPSGRPKSTIRLKQG